MAIKLTTDPFRADFRYPFTNKSYGVFKKLQSLCERGNRSVITQILDAASKFSDQPHFLNLAVQYYNAVGEAEKAASLNAEIRQQFPDYLFGRVNASLVAYQEKQPEQMLELLGSQLTLEAFEPGRKVFHTWEYVGYTKAVMLYYSLIEDTKAALERILESKELSEKYKFDIRSLKTVYTNLMLEVGRNSSFHTAQPDLPQFENEEIKDLFNYSIDIPLEKYETILKNDREVALRDLTKVFQYGINHYDYYMQKDVPDENTFFIWHATLLLKDLEATELLTVFLNFLKQDESAVEFYLGDLLQEYGWEILYATGKDDLRGLTAFFKELTDEYTIRTAILETLEQIGFHEPERGLEIEAYLRELLLFVQTVDLREDAYIDEVTDKLIDVITEGGYKHLFTDVRKALEENSLPLIVPLTVAEFEGRCSQASEEDYRKELTSSKDIYGEYLKSQSEEEDEDDDDFDFSGDFDDDEDEELDFDNYEDYLNELDENDKYEDMLEAEYEVEDEEDKNESNSDKRKDYIDFTESSRAPLINSEPKVGRNDPCPCGSGKKYKKCHGKSE